MAKAQRSLRLEEARLDQLIRRMGRLGALETRELARQLKRCRVAEHDNRLCERPGGDTETGEPWRASSAQPEVV